VFIGRFEQTLKTKKNILVCPLDWGLGHATRLVPVIDLLLQEKHNVIIGADNRPLAFLKQRFPACESIVAPGFAVEYPKNGSMALAMLKAYPAMMRQAKKSKEILKDFISEKKIDVIISDNRYELTDRRTYNILITHQLNIQTPGILNLASPFIQKKLNSFIKNFNETWIPDIEGKNNLAGKLSHGKKFPTKNCHFIGPLSRFDLLPQIEKEKKNDLLILLSGPEPQRSILEKKLIGQAQEMGLKTIVLQGKPELSENRQEKNVQIISHLPDDELAGLIKSSKTVICRSGYSTIMDLAVTGSKAILIPTPGQTEQEYLAKRFLKEKIFYSESQKEFQLQRAVEMSESFTGLSMKWDNSLLKEKIEKL
jgi:uncharacterized protein (TIGR00661 family)